MAKKPVYAESKIREAALESFALIQKIARALDKTEGVVPSYGTAVCKFLKKIAAASAESCGGCPDCTGVCKSKKGGCKKSAK